MENNNTITTATDTQTETNQDVDTSTTVENNSLETSSISTEEHQKIVQSECDKIRTEYSQKLKAVEAELQSLRPVEKSEADLQLEARLADLEKRNAEVEQKEKLLNLQSNLTQKGFSADLVDFIKSDCDVDSFAVAIDAMFTEKVKANGFVPQGHAQNAVLTRADFDKMTTAEKSKLFTSNRTLYDKLSKEK